MKHQIIVSNIGTVYDGDDFFEAHKNYYEYVRQSKGKFGRAAGEDVTWLKDDEIAKEHFGWLQSQELCPFG